MALERIRKEIDSIDDALLELLNRRCELALQVGKHKRESGTPFYVPEREKALVDRLSSRNNGPLTDKALKAVFREVVSASTALQHPLRVASLGGAARDMFGASIEVSEKDDVEGVFLAVEKGECDYGSVPLREDGGGFVVATCKALFRDFDSRVIAEMESANGAACAAIGKQNPAPTGDDHALLAATVKRPAEAAAIISEALSLHGIEPIAFWAGLSETRPDSKDVLVEIAGHSDDENLERVRHTLVELLGESGTVRAFGGHPVL